MIAPIGIVARMMQQMIVGAQQIIDAFLAIDRIRRILLGVSRSVEVNKTVASAPDAILVDVTREFIFIGADGNPVLSKRLAGEQRDWQGGVPPSLQVISPPANC